MAEISVNNYNNIDTIKTNINRQAPVSAPVQLSYPPDTVEISANKNVQKQKDGMSTLSKWAIGLGSALVAVAFTGIAFAKHQSNKLTKLYNEKMQFVNLAEKIDFKEAKTIEEGIKFAKEVLKIGEVGNGFTLDAINYVNKGLVDVSNANKGHLFMPKKIHYKANKNDTWSACVIQDIKSKHFGELYINPKCFSDEFLNEALNRYLGIKSAKNVEKVVENIVEKNASNTVKNDIKEKVQIKCCVEERVLNLIRKYQKSPDLLSIPEKREVYYNLQQAADMQDSLLLFSPFNTLQKYKNNFEKYGININLDELSRMTTEKQSEKLKEFFIEYQKKSGKNEIEINIPYNPSTKTIYHEMGHLQDFAKNLKELDLKQFNFSFKDAYKEVKEGKKHTADIDHVNNRWGGITYDGYKDLLTKNPDKFKKRYPDLYEFLTNQEIQQTTGKVSWYAQTSIGEFIADVYAKMVKGEKLSDDVMALYKKYNGPMLS